MTTFIFPFFNSIIKTSFINITKDIINGKSRVTFLKAFSTNTLAQVILVKIAQFIQFKEAIRDEQFWEIGPYLDEFENLSQLREDTLENQKIDDKLYSLYMGRPLSRHGIIYRKDWADNLGIEAPKNTDDFFEMLRAFTEDDPDGNG